MTRFGTKKNRNTQLFFGGWRRKSSHYKAALDATLTFEQEVSFRGFGEGEGMDAGDFEFHCCWEGGQKQGGWLGMNCVAGGYDDFGVTHVSQKSIQCKAATPESEVVCFQHHPLKGLEMIFFSTQNVKYFWRVFGTSARFVTAYPTGGATQHFFLALLSWAENLGISKKKENNSRQPLVQVFLGNGGMFVWSFVFQHLYVFWKEGGNDFKNPVFFSKKWQRCTEVNSRGRRKTLPRRYCHWKDLGLLTT